MAKVKYTFGGIRQTLLTGGGSNNFFLRQIATRKAGELRPPACSNRRFTCEKNCYSLLLPDSFNKTKQKFL